MESEYQDDRTNEERATHSVIVSAIDPGLSGWGRAKGGKSVAAWACLPDQADLVLAWVKGRGELKAIRVSDHAFRRGAAHTHIYCVRIGHAALASE